jgi:hypothetical protein
MAILIQLLASNNVDENDILERTDSYLKPSATRTPLRLRGQTRPELKGGHYNSHYYSGISTVTAKLARW